MLVRTEEPQPKVEDFSFCFFKAFAKKETSKKEHQGIHEEEMGILSDPALDILTFTWS